VARPTGSTRIPDRAIQQQLGRIMSSATFQAVDRLRMFLQFIVTEAAAGRGDELKEYVVGVHVFGKEASFDPRTDPIVRVQARRLRARLGRYYAEEGQSDEITIELPKGRYAPTFKRTEGGAAPRRSIGATFVSRNTITVLPFADHSQAGDLGYLCKSATQQVIHRLTQIKTLRVMANSLGQSPDQPDSPEIGDALNAAVVVAGSVRRSGDRVVITTQIIDSVTSSYLSSQSVQAPAGDATGLENAIADAVAAQIEPVMFAEGGRGSARLSENLAAHNLYLQGKYHLSQRTEEGLLKAAEFFERATVEDPQYALAHSGLADSYGLLSHYGVVRPAEAWARSASSAASAVMLDGNSAEAHTSLAHVKATQDWDWPGAERAFQRAIGLNPRYPTAHHWYAVSCLVPMGRLDEALEQMLFAQSLDPVSSIIARDLAVVHCYRGEFDAALEQCDHTIALNPHFSPAYLTLGIVQEQRKDYDEAAAAFERAVHLSPLSHRMTAALGRTLALSGKRQKATRIVKSLETLAKTRYVSPFDFASIQFGLGHIDVGFRWLSRACDDRCFELLALLVDPRLDSIRSDRRFMAIAKRVSLR